MREGWTILIPEGGKHYHYLVDGRSLCGNTMPDLGLMLPIPGASRLGYDCPTCYEKLQERLKEKP